MDEQPISAINNAKNSGQKRRISPKKSIISLNNANHKASFPDIESCLSPTLMKEIEEKERLERRKELLQSSPNLKDLADRLFNDKPIELHACESNSKKISKKEQTERQEKYFINEDEK